MSALFKFFLWKEKNNLIWHLVSEKCETLKMYLQKLYLFINTLLHIP